MLEFTLVMVIFLTMKIIYANLCYICLNFKNKKISNIQNLPSSNFLTFFNMFLILNNFVEGLEHT